MTPGPLVVFSTQRPVTRGLTIFAVTSDGLFLQLVWGHCRHDRKMKKVPFESWNFQYFFFKAYPKSKKSKILNLSSKLATFEDAIKIVRQARRIVGCGNWLHYPPWLFIWCNQSKKNRSYFLKAFLSPKSLIQKKYFYFVELPLKLQDRETILSLLKNLRSSDFFKRYIILKIYFKE